MDKEKFEQIKLSVDKDLFIDEDNIMDMSYQVINIHRKYFNIFVQEQHVLQNLIAKNHDYRAKIFIGLKNGSLKVAGLEGYDISKKVDFEELIGQDKEYFRQLLIINQQKEIVNYFENVLDNINKINYSIKNYIDIKKFKLGYL